MSVTTHERPGVYSSYDASSVVRGGSGGNESRRFRMGELEADGAKGANPNARRDTAKLAESNALRCIIMKRN